MTESAEALIDEGRAALQVGDASGARRAFEAALARRESGEALEGLAQSIYLETDYAAAADAYERAYAAHRRDGEIAGAGRCARMLSWIYGNVIGDWAVQSGWVRRACTILDQADDGTAERGWLEMLKSYSETDPDLQQKGFRRALEIGRAAGDPSLEFEALGWLGLTAVLAGRLDGLEILDEALAAVVAGEVEELFVVEGSFCGMLWGCEVAHDVARAQQWMRAAEEVRRRRNLPAMASFCRAHYGSILTAAGRWSEAETELVEAARMFEGSETRMRVSALVRLADLRVRQGRFEEAEQLLQGLDRHADALPPLAALHLARGDLALARDVIDRGVGGEIEGSTDAQMLALLIDVAVQEGNVEEARAAADRLGTLAEQQGGPYLCALAALARGQVCVASGTEGARACLDEALTGFAEAQMPLELARTRLELARALIDDRPEVAIAEAKTALEEFEGLAAARHADATGALLRQLGAPVRTGPKGVGALTKRETEVLELLGLGLSNPEISDRLFISRKTVEHHVGNVLAKLGLRSRAEAAAYATRQDAEKTSQ